MRLTALFALLLAALSLGLAACGDDDDDDGGGSDQPPAFEVEINDDGVTAPETAGAGALELRVSNTGKRDHSAQVVAIGDGHSADEVLAAGEEWGDKGGLLPEWIEFVGGVGTTKGGGTGTAVVELPAGEYGVFDIDGEAADAFAAFTVEGDDGGGLPDTDSRVEAVDYSFNAEGLQAGSQSVTFENAGEEPHHLVGAPLLPGKTEADVKKFVETEKGESPVDESKFFNTAIVSGGDSAVVDLRLESGDYAFLCFIPDREGGPPHVAKGMVAVVPVE
ncbi:MAG: hypothetical protein ACRDJY_01415 [Thermoleophilaceae bacterium]